MRNNKIIPKTIIGLTTLSALILGVGSHYFYKQSVARGPKSILQDNKDLEILSKVDPEDSSGKKSEQNSEAPRSSEGKFSGDTEDASLWLQSKNLQKCSISSFDGLKLNAYYLSAKEPSDYTVILVHGYTSKGLDMAGFTRFYHEELGYNVLMPDNRGHGESDGHYIGFGWHDRLDYLRWIKYLIELNGERSRIALHGISMGGAAVMMLSGEALPNQVKAIIEDCGYASVDAQLAYQLKRIYKLPAFPLLNTTSILSKLKAGYNFHEASSIEQVKKATVPMFFIHGNEDTFVPTYMVYDVYEACASEDKELWIVPGAGHGLSYRTNPKAYIDRVDRFLSKYM